MPEDRDGGVLLPLLHATIVRTAASAAADLNTSCGCYLPLLPQCAQGRFGNEVTRFVFLAAVLILAAACSVSRGCQLCTAPSSSVGYDVVATNTDHAVTMHVGQKLEVVLRAGQGMNNWSHPASSDTSVLEPIVDPAATAAIGVTLTAFQAVKPGQAEITSSAGSKCSPGHACPMFVALYSLRVTVAP